LQLPAEGIATYALDWQLCEIGGKVEKAPPKDGSYRTLDIPPFLADLLRWAINSQRPACVEQLTIGPLEVNVVPCPPCRADTFN
jgi:hypothetical protein